MESLIIWIVILAIGFAYDWAKKKHAPTEKSQQKSGITSFPAPYDTPFARQVQNHYVNDWPTEEQIKYSEESAHKPVSNTIHKYTPITNLPDSDSPLQVENPDELPDKASIQLMSAEEQEARLAHYCRWRKAIIDTQILERKF